MAPFPEYASHDGLGLAALIRSKQVTPLEILDQAIAGLERVDGRLNAVVTRLFDQARTRAGSPVMGMVLTLVIVVDEDEAESAMEAAREASHEHPARVLGVILGDGRGAGRVDAQVGTGQGWSGETAMIRMRGEVCRHAESVVLPLLLPDAPVAVWWPCNPPEDPAADPLGALGQRRITDAAAATRARTKAMEVQSAAYARGNTDLAWTRLTRWRALLAASLDQHPLKTRRASVEAERISPSADLLVAWLQDRLKVPVERRSSDGPGITEVVMATSEGDIRIWRPSGGLATFSSPGRPDRHLLGRHSDRDRLDASARCLPADAATRLWTVPGTARRELAT